MKVREDVFTAGLARLGALCRFDAEPSTQAELFMELEGDTSDDEWSAFVPWAAREGMFQGACPSLFDLLEGLRQFRLSRPRPPNPRALPQDDGEPGLTREEALEYMRRIISDAGARPAKPTEGWRPVFEGEGKAAADNRGTGRKR